MRHEKVFFAITFSCLFVFPIERLLAEIEQQKPTPPEISEEENSEQAQVGSVSEYVFVEGSLPFVPTSNTIVNKLPLKRRLTPNNTGIVTSPLLNEQLARTASEALINVSNINIQTQNSVHDFFSIRGFDSLSSGLILTDGSPEPEATFYQMYNVERIEVLKGPGGFLYGSNPLAGAVNIVRKQPLPTSFFDFKGSAGSFDTFEGAFDWNTGSVDQPFSYRINGLLRDQGSHRPGKGGKTRAINPSISWRPNESTWVNLNIEYMSASFTPDSGLPVMRDELVAVDRGTNYQSPLDASEQELFRFQLDVEKEVSDFLTIRNKFYRRDLDWESNGTIYSGAFPTGPTSFGLIRNWLELSDNQEITGNQFEAVLSFKTGSIQHALLAGLELTRYADVFTLGVNLLPMTDLYNPAESTNSTPIPLPGASFGGDAKSLTIAPYIIDQIDFKENIHLLVGGRLDKIDFKDKLTNRERDDSEFSPMFGLLYAPTEQLSVYGSFSRAFAQPSPRVIGQNSPEKSFQLETGIKKHFTNINGEVTLAIYQLSRENIPIADDSGFTQQIGNQRSRGIEIDFAAKPTSNSTAIATYAFNNATLTNFKESIMISLAPPAFAVFDRSGNRPAFAPAHILNFWLNHNLSERWSIGGGGNFVSSQFIAEDNLFEIESRLTLDATVAYRLRKILLRLNLRNLTNKEYYLRGFGGTSVIPAPPISAYFTVEVKM